MSLFGKKQAIEPEVEAQVRPRPKYGIDEAIQLMRTLPLDQHPDLIVLVVKNTLASMNVSLKDTLRDAANRHEVVSKRIAELHANIADLEQQIRIKKEHVASAEAELAELERVTERLEAAVSLHEPSITPPVVVARPPANATPRVPPVPRSKPAAGSVRPEPQRDTIELRDSAIEVEPVQRDAKAP